jgi:nitrous oxidase accessory protein NosD
VPPGTWNFSAAYAYKFASATLSFSLVGAGADVSVVNFTGSSGGLAFDYLGPNNSVHVRDLSLVTAAGGSATGLSLVQTVAVADPALGALSDVRGVTLRGSLAAPATEYWATAISVSGVSNVNFSGLNIVGPTGAAYSSTGNGIALSGSTGAPAVAFNVTGSNFNYLGTGIVYGSAVQGLTVAQSNFTGDAYGILVAAGGSGLDQLAVSGSQFNCQNEGILAQSWVPNTLIQGNLFIVPNTGVGIQLNAAGLYSLSGNSFNTGSATAGAVYPIGVVLTASNAPGVITGNSFDHMNVGVVLQAGTGAVNVQSNTYSNTATSVSNAGTGNLVGGGSP